MLRIIIYPVNLFIIFLEGLAQYFLLMIKMFRSVNKLHLYFGYAFEQMVQIGIQSIPIVMLTSLFSGMVTSVQAAYQFESGYIPTWFIGSIVGESVLLELAPMITGLVMTGKIGATITAEIGTMRVTEQIDALESLSFDPVSFLIMPRVFAAAIMFPILVIISDFMGIIGGLVAAVNSMDVSSQEFIRGLRTWFVLWDACFGLIKAFFFGIAITSIASYKGFYTEGGAQGVGKATTSSVVISCIAIVFLDYILAEILL